MIYLIDPVDNFFFRTPIPFEAGGETALINGVFPPLPSVYAGAFRTHMTNHEGIRLKIGCNGLWLKDSLYFPKPLDLYISKKDGGEITFFKSMELRKKALSNYPLEYMPYIPQRQMEKEKNQTIPYLSENSLFRYLNGENLEIAGVDIGSYIKEESKVGIGVDPQSGTSEDQLLYQTAYIRPIAGLKLAVETNFSLSDNGLNSNAGGTVIKLGGEGKTARIKPTDHSISAPVQSDGEKYFKLYFATPAILKKGWLPGWLDEKTMTGWFKYKKREIKVKLLSACVGRKVLCGGFGYDKINREYRPRELRYAVPAGSVYYFEILQGSFEDALKLFHMKCISDYRESMGFDYMVYNRSRYCDRGFGYAFVGKLNQCLGGNGNV